MLIFNFSMGIIGVFLAGAAFQRKEYVWLLLMIMPGIYFSVAAIGAAV